MGDIDPQTLSWLKSLKLSKNFKSYSDFQNGYNFGSIFDKLNLSKGRKFKNSPDMACIFHNYKNAKDLLMQNFGVDFPINNIIYRTEDLLKAVRNQCIKYSQIKKQSTLKGSLMPQPSQLTTILPQQRKMFSNRQRQITINSKLMMNQTEKQMPQKILQIQKKLEKYRQQKTKAQLLALEQRKNQIQQARRLVQDHRQYEINKVRNNHAFVKTMQQKVYDVCAKTQQVKRLRIQKDQQFNKFMQSKKDNFVNSLRADEQKNYSDGMQVFQLNCMRQGVQLQHDPDKPAKSDGVQFNQIVVMERIKNNIKKHEIDKKQRIKRENRKKVDADQAKIKSDAIWSQKNLIQKYQKQMVVHFLDCQKIYKQKLQKKAQSQSIKTKFSKKQFVDLPKFGNEQQRKQQFRKNNIMYLKKDIQFLQKRYQSRKEVAEQIIEAFLQITVEFEDTFHEKGAFTYSQWKKVEQIFMKFAPKKPTAISANEDYYLDLSVEEKNYNDYIQRNNEWSLYNDKQAIEKEYLNHQMADLVNKIIDISYPPQQIPQKNDIHIKNLPLKMAFVGNNLTGKTTHSIRFAQKYGLTIIDPALLIKEALELAKPPPVEDPKKAAKKIANKPQDESAQKLALKQFGVKLLEKIDSIQNATPQIFIDVIKFRLKQLYTKKNEQQLISQFEEAKQKQKTRHAQALKDFQDISKKPKKDSKKGSVELALQDAPIQNSYFYSKGFIIDSYPFNDIRNLKFLEKQLNNYIEQSQRLNPNGQRIRMRVSQLLPIPKRVEDSNLKDGTFDLVFQLRASMSALMKRNQGRKIDPQTQIVYHPDYNPVPTQVKGFAQKLVDLPTVILKEQSNFNAQQEFYRFFGDNRNKMPAYQVVQETKILKLEGGEQNQSQKKEEKLKEKQQQSVKQVELSIGQTFNQINSIVQNRLKSKYNDIIQLKNAIQKRNNQKQGHISKQSQDKEEQIQTIKKLQNAQKQQQIQDSNANKQIIDKQANLSTEQNNQGTKKVGQKAQQQPKIVQTIDQIINTLPKQVSKALLDNYLAVSDKYSNKMKETLHQLSEVRKNFGRSLLNVQKNFVSLIIRPDDKAGKILSFQQNYNKLLSQKLSIVKDSEASKHLVEKLDELYDSLWDSLQAKKNEAVNERLQFINSSWLNQQVSKIVQVAKKMMQIELNYITEQLFFLFAVNCARQGISIDFVPQYLSLGIAPNLQPIYSVDSQQLVRNDRLDYLVRQMTQCLNSIPKWIIKKQKKLKAQKSQTLARIVQSTIKKQQIRVLQRLQNIRKRLTQRALQEKSYFSALVNKMDDWIIFGIKSENDFVYDIYKVLKRSIQQAKKSSVKDIHVRPITEYHQPINQLSVYPIKITQHSPIKNIPIFSYKIFLEQIRCLANRQGKIELKTFSIYFQKRIKSKLLDKYLLRLDLDILQQYLVIEDHLNFRQLALAMLLADFPICEQSSISDYKNYFQENFTSGKVSIEQFVLAGIQLNQGQQYSILRQLVFQIFRDPYSDKVDVNSYIDTLSVFNQLQVLKYGDSIMMLIEDHMIHHDTH